MNWSCYSTETNKEKSEAEIFKVEWFRIDGVQCRCWRYWGWYLLLFSYLVRSISNFFVFFRTEIFRYEGIFRVGKLKINKWYFLRISNFNVRSFCWFSIVLGCFSSSHRITYIANVLLPYWYYLGFEVLPIWYSLGPKCGFLVKPSWHYSYRILLEFMIINCMVFDEINIKYQYQPI